MFTGSIKETKSSQASNLQEENQAATNIVLPADDSSAW